MKKVMLTTALVLAGMMPAALAHARSHEMGDTFTQALNAIEACGKLDMFSPQKYVPIISISSSQGLVTVTLKEGQPNPIVFDPGTNKFVTEGVCP